MIIKDNRPPGTLEFGRLNIGDCFVFDHDYYIKTGSVDGKRNNAFNLNQNYMMEFGSDELVTHVIWADNAADSSRVHLNEETS